jgi:hypothetical protein
VRPDRVGVVGWSEGGGAVLFAIGGQSPGQQAQLPQGEFRAAVAFYPASCNERRQGAWTSTIPLLVLIGVEDVWTPAAPCKELLNGAAARGAEVNGTSIREPIMISTGPTWRDTSRQIIAPPPASSPSKGRIPPRDRMHSLAFPFSSDVPSAHGLDPWGSSGRRAHSLRRHRCHVCDRFFPPPRIVDRQSSGSQASAEGY